MICPPSFVRSSVTAFRIACFGATLGGATVTAQTTVTGFSWSHFAGTVGGPGHSDGTGASARFLGPEGVAFDQAGNVIVADTGNQTIRIISSSGAVRTLAGLAETPGSADGTLAQARFSFPFGVAVDPAGNIVVADTRNNTVRLITPAGMVSTLAGSAGVAGSTDGTGGAALFSSPVGVVADAAGNVFVADSFNQAVRRITPAGVVTTVAGGPGSSAFTGPESLTLDGAGKLYVTDTDLTTVLGPLNESGYARLTSVVRVVGLDGAVTTLDGTTAWSDNTGLPSTSPFPAYASSALDAAGNIFMVSEGFLGTNTVGGVRKVAPDGTATILAGTSSLVGFGLAVDRVGNIAIAGTFDHTIRRIDPSGTVTTLAGLAPTAGSNDGTGGNATFNQPTALTLDAGGNIYVVDFRGTTVRKIAPDGTVTTFAGTAGQFGTVDGTGATIQFMEIIGIAVDRAGIVYVADAGGSNLRKITPDGVSSTFRNFALQYQGSGMGSIAVDAPGNIYYSDAIFQTIEKVSPDGTAIILAGTPGTPPFQGATDGTGPTARFVHISGLALDGTGNLFAADSGASTIRKITPDGVVTTVAGSAGNAGSTDGVGIAARFADLKAIAVGADGNLFVVDGSAIREISPAGAVTTIGSTSVGTGSADGLGTAAEFNNPAAIGVDRAGRVYVTDQSNNAIRIGQPAGPPIIAIQPQSQAITPGASAQFSVQATSALPLTYQWYFNGIALAGAATESLSVANAQTANAGDYTVIVSNELGNATSAKATLSVSASTAGSGAASPPGGSSGGGALDPGFALVLLGLAATQVRKFTGRS